MRSVEERLRSYEPLWENWTYTGEFLGEGAMSSVFEIQSTAMGLKEIAALKIITVKKGPRGEVEIPESTLNEITILRTLSECPNIVRYHDSTQRKIFDKDNNLSEIDILIKMEKLEPLTEGKKLAEKEVIKLGCDMCRALEHAFNAGIIHRDIKPQNIFVSKDGTYKLGDFGIAKIVSDFSSHYTMNIGTMAYTAPEVQSGASGGRYDISSDVYSLGLVLYVFLNNGYLPFSDKMSTYDAVMKRLQGAPFPSPANGSKKLKSIIMRACNADPVKRFRTPKEMLEALELLSSGGKKLVLDPFATLDANIDEITNPDADSKAPKDKAFDVITDSSATASVSRGGLKIRMSHSPEEIKKSPVTKSGLKINMSSTFDTAKTKLSSHLSGETEAKGEPEVSSDKTVIAASDSYVINKESVSSEKTGVNSDSKLKINLKSTIGKDDETVIKAKDTDKKDKDSDGDFFFTPPSL